jgi:hypothetical protein
MTANMYCHVPHQRGSLTVYLQMHLFKWVPVRDKLACIVSHYLLLGTVLVAVKVDGRRGPGVDNAVILTQCRLGTARHQNNLYRTFDVSTHHRDGGLLNGPSVFTVTNLPNQQGFSR